ncbi:MAG TPA: STAS domain-containing protein [Mycobacterium sp.]
MTVTSIRSRSADSRQFSIASTSLAISCRTRGTEIVVSVRGEVDAANAKEFARSVREAAGSRSGLVLDLSEVPFLAFDGVSALYAISAHLLREDVPWCVVASPAVSRVLTLCDPEGLIPLAGVSPLRSAETA